MAMSREAERETRSAATGTVALPRPCGSVRESTDNVGEPFFVAWGGSQRLRWRVNAQPEMKTQRMGRY